MSNPFFSVAAYSPCFSHPDNSAAQVPGTFLSLIPSMCALVAPLISFTCHYSRLTLFRAWPYRDYHDFRLVRRDATCCEIAMFASSSMSTLHPASTTEAVRFWTGVPLEPDNGLSRKPALLQGTSWTCRSPRSIESENGTPLSLLP